MSRGPNLERRKDLERAIKNAGPKDELDIQALADLWGTAKPTFVNTLRQVERQFEVPRYREGDRGTHIFPAKRMLTVLLAYERRNDKMVEQRQAKAAKILGRSPEQVSPEDAMLPISELAQLSRVMAETEERERAQRLMIPADEVSRVIIAAFSIQSTYLSELDANVDPNGILPAEVRAIIRQGGRDTALRCHAEMKHLMAGHAEPGPPSGTRSRKPNDRVGGKAPRRERPSRRK